MSKKYQVALSFAGEDRPYVEDIAERLKRAGVRVFYDGFEQTELWGENLIEHFELVYRDNSDYVVIFASKYYLQKHWPRYERRIVQARAFKVDGVFLLPVRFDDTEIPGIPETTGYIDLRKMSPTAFCEILLKKIGIDPKPQPVVPTAHAKGDPVPLLMPVLPFLYVFRILGVTEHQLQVLLEESIMDQGPGFLAIRMFRTYFDSMYDQAAGYVRQLPLLSDSPSQMFDQLARLVSEDFEAIRAALAGAEPDPGADWSSLRDSGPVRTSAPQLLDLLRQALEHIKSLRALIEVEIKNQHAHILRTG